MSSNDRNSPPPPEMSRRRGSVTQATLSTLFQRSSMASGSSGTAAFPSPIATAAMGDQRRRLSMSAGAGVGLSGTSPTSTFLRRASLSTNASEAIDESAVEEDDMSGRPAYNRRMSLGAGASAASMRSHRGIPPSPGTNGTHNTVPATPVGQTANPFTAATHRRARSVAGLPSGNWSSARDKNHSPIQASSVFRGANPLSNIFPPRPDQGFNWSDQLRTRAESLTMSNRPTFAPSTSLPRGVTFAAQERAKPVAEMPAPPAQASTIRPPRESRKPDAFQERILKGDFYMD